MAASKGLLLALALAFTLLAAQTGPVAARSKRPYKTETPDSPADRLNKVRNELLAAAQLPEESQKALLNVMGAGLVVSGQLSCNIFGGSNACTEIDQYSKFGRTCPSTNLKVDCAFKAEAEQEMEQDPHEVMRDKLAKEGYPPCDACFDALHDFWCGQTVPTCGTFELVVDEILPVIGDVVHQRASPVAALQKAVPRVLKALSLGLTCQEMCEDITDTCGCGKTFTFGQIMTSLQKKGQSLPYATNMSTVTAQHLFKSIWSKPVCELFAEKDMPGFMGVCKDEEDNSNEKKCAWCKDNKGPSEVQEQIVAQVAESMSGMMQAGLQEVLEYASSASAKLRKAQATEWNWQDPEEAPPRRSGGMSWTAVVLFLLVICGAAAGGLGWFLHKQRQASSQYVDLNEMEYRAPVL